MHKVHKDKENVVFYYLTNFYAGSVPSYQKNVFSLTKQSFFWLKQW